jgi:hypothetical protein
MKKFTFKGVLDGFRSSVGSQGAGGAGAQNSIGKGGPDWQEIVETLKPENFTVTKVLEIFVNFEIKIV